MRTAVLFSLLTVLAAALGVACSSKSASGSSAITGEDSGPEDAGCALTQFMDDASLTSPTVSFQNDVLPILQGTCGTSPVCHAGAERGVFLGCSASTVVSGSCSLAGDETQLVYSGLVGKDASAPVEENCMPYVTAGDPTRSYLMHKLDGDMCVVDCCITNNAQVQKAEGTAPPSGWCGAQMPYQLGPLPAGPVCGGASDCDAGSFARDTIRAWIKQGAANN